jgi:hypothetical protein
LAKGAIKLWVGAIGKRTLSLALFFGPFANGAKFVLALASLANGATFQWRHASVL